MTCMPVLQAARMLARLKRFGRARKREVARERGWGDWMRPLEAAETAALRAVEAEMGTEELVLARAAAARELAAEWADARARGRGALGSCEALERREAEKQAIDDRKRKEEIEFLKHQGAHLESFLASIDKN